MDSKDFFNPKLSGKRFDDHAIPLELLEDFTLYQELLLKAAKWVYYQEHGRVRVPKGFGSGVSLKLSGVGTGSAIANIRLEADSFFVGDLDTFPFYEQARDRIIKSIDAAEKNIAINGYLSPELYGYFNKIGKRLKDDEFIDFAPDSTIYRAKLTKTNRKRLALASPNVDLVRSEASIRGVISALDKREQKCTIVASNDVKIQARVSKEYNDVFVEAFNGYEKNLRVLVSGIGMFNKQDKLESFENVDSITILDPLDVPSRLEEFLILKEGWLDGDGKSFKKEDLLWLSNCFDTKYSRELILPFTFPTVDGGIQFEWKNRDHDVTLYLNFSDLSGYLHYLNTSTDESYEREMNFGSDTAWDDLNGLLLQYFKI